ncbi:protein trichome birefringence-like 8 isoform X2 [Nicotiana tomentosiformis]|uniref:protein trichome birefringence-like 8 isoform X2 n=1 Tax=Nicotiana tomentosiformis TaxID=4098 RepID=UPI00051B1B8B|nr:protein trichome birefringence-like 8 isoform X2 [Nicotiana tomentosiformis]
MDLQPVSREQQNQKQPTTTNNLFVFFYFPLKLANKDFSYALLFFLFLLFSFILFYNILSPLQPQYLLGIGFLSKILPKTSEISSKTCDYSYGKWIWDESYVVDQYTENCPFLDPGFRCRESGRRDLDYRKWRWQPQGCDLTKFNAKDFLERSRNGRIVFAGDSIGRNQWESMICMLAQGVSNLSTIYEESGNPITKHRGFLSMHFHEYNLTVEYYRVPFLVVVDRPPANALKEVRGVIRLDKLHWYFTKWVEADIIIFNAGHWWNEDKTVKMGIHFQEGTTVNMTMNVAEAFQRSLNTWASWLIQNTKAEKSHIFFRSFSPVHYRDGAWNEGGHCHTNIAPETDYTKLEREPINNIFISEVVKQMESTRRNITFLNVTYLSEFRKDGHPSEHREPGTPAGAPQDCSHWCLPGVPDTWNELLYAHLLLNGFRTKSK